jgi:sulfur-carrier protein adenylyltransferase/sulfurtransferase
MNIKDLTPEALRDFMRHHHEREYALIDVRQPGEYEQSHIPGARLLPLPELIQTMATLPADKQLVFYCHSGGRSMAAASMVADEEIGSRELINLNGGMLAWDGGVASNYPNVQLFNRQTGPADMLRTAMNLEKGALNFYTHVSEHYQGQPWVDVFTNLAKAEIGHARTVFHFLRKIESEEDDFDTVFDGLSGEVLEGGMKLSTALENLSAIKTRICLRIIETALKIEYAAFDLYRTMADRVCATDAQEAFITIAQAEKAHMQALAKAIDRCN